MDGWTVGRWVCEGMGKEGIRRDGGMGGWMIDGGMEGWEHEWVGG